MTFQNSLCDPFLALKRAFFIFQYLYCLILLLLLQKLAVQAIPFATRYFYHLNARKMEPLNGAFWPITSNHFSEFLLATDAPDGCVSCDCVSALSNWQRCDSTLWCRIASNLNYGWWFFGTITDDFERMRQSTRH